MQVWDDKGRLEDIRVPDFPFPLGTAASMLQQCEQ